MTEATILFLAGLVPDWAAGKHDETHEFALPENTGLGKDMLEMSFRGIQCDAKCIRDILKRFPMSDLKRDAIPRASGHTAWQGPRSRTEGVVQRLG